MNTKTPQNKIIVKKIAEEFINIQLRFVFGSRERFGSSDLPTFLKFVVQTTTAVQ